jgi:hypothetical protein
VWETVREALRGSTPDYTTAPIGRAVIMLAIPMVVEMAMASIVAVADVFWIGVAVAGVAVLGEEGFDEAPRLNHDPLVGRLRGTRAQKRGEPMTRGLALVGLLLLSNGAALAQTLPPTDPASLGTVAGPTEIRKRVAGKLGVDIDALTTKQETAVQSEVDKTMRGYLLSHPSVLPLAIADDRAPDGDGLKRILDFYQRSQSFNAADQVQFLYGFGAQKRKGLSADLFALFFPGGVRVALGSTVTATDGDDEATPETPEQAVQRIRDGGDMYVTAVYPLLAKSTSVLSTSVFMAPRLNFVFDGFGGADTVTEASEHTFNVGAEWYLEFKDLEGLGKAFTFWRLGYQQVSDAFQQATHLESAGFAVSQFAVGFVFNDLIRVSGQRFTAPPAAAGLSAEKLRGWHLVVQLAPKRKP